MKYRKSLDFARRLDRTDPLKAFRHLFHIPKINGKTSVYLTGNSLGLLPKSTKTFIDQELNDWAKLGVEGHFHAKRPWLYYHKFSKKALATLTGALTSEVVAMNQLTVNLHLMLISFYRPAGKRFRIITEAGAFPSDQYALETQVRFHGFDPEDAIIELQPRAGEYCLRTEDILGTIEAHKDEIALVILGAVQYFSGQFFKIRLITEAGHRAGAIVGFDLAHAIGNVPLQLHRDDVDFAVWCSYKYLNSGPGGVAGAFIHQRHGGNRDIPRLAGWWGHDEKVRFRMEKGFRPMPGVDGWQVSNFPVLSGAAHLASLEIFLEAGMKPLIRKSRLLTGYLEFLLKEIQSADFTVITPENVAERGCQVSILMNRNGKRVFKALSKKGVIADWREFNLPVGPRPGTGVIRVAPVPLYNTFEDVYRFASIFKDVVNTDSRAKS